MVKNALTHNLGFKIPAMVLAVIVWLLVLNAEDPVITREFSNLTVTEINADVIAKAGKAYSFVDGADKVNVEVSGRTSIVNKVTRDDILATVDLAKITDITGAVPVDLSCDKYPSLELSTEGSSGIVRIEIEDITEKSLNIQVITSGNDIPGKYVGSGTCKPNIVTISGPESVVSQVASAQVRVAVNDENKTDIGVKEQIDLVDSKGNSLSKSLLTLSSTSVYVKIPIYNIKTVPIELEIIGTVPDGYSITSSEYEPKEITVAGPDEALEKVESVVLRDYNISDSTGKIEKSLVIADDLKESLPEGVCVTDSSATLALAIDIEKSGEETFYVPVSQLELTGESDEYDYSVTGDSSDSISVILSGTEEMLRRLSADDLTGNIDVSGLAAGEYSLDVSIELSDGLTLAEQPSVQVIVTAKESESQY